MKIQVLFIILGLFLVSCKNQQGLDLVTNSYDSGSVMEEFQVDESGVRNGTYKSYYESGKIREEAIYKDEKYTGKRTLYFENGQPEIEEFYAEPGVLDGVYKLYNESGKLLIEKNYTENVLSGWFKKYYESGQIQEEVMMEDNNENGPFTEYYENGQVHWKGTYLNGDNEFGLLEEWDEEGNMLKRMKCDSFAVCRTFWRPGEPEVDYDTVQIQTLINKLGL